MLSNSRSFALTQFALAVLVLAAGLQTGARAQNTPPFAQPNRIDQPVPPQPFANPNRNIQRLPGQPLPQESQFQSAQPLSNPWSNNRNPGIGSTFPGELSVRIKDITSIAGHRSNRLEGLGIVIGLNGTGGKSQDTRDAARNLYQNYDIITQGSTGSTSVVMVTAEIPPFAQSGEKVTAKVAVLDDASSLFGGTLLNTALYGFDGEVYAVAGGGMVADGFTAQGAAASVSKNHGTSATVPATIELEIEQGPAFPRNAYQLLLKNKDYATAFRIASKINQAFPGFARAINQGAVEVTFPRQYLNAKMDFVVMVNEMRVVPDIPARVVINQRTGTIVVGQNVRLSTFMVAEGNLIITTNETPFVSQPNPLSEGQTVVAPQTQLTATETGSRYHVVNQQMTVGDLAAALNTLGVSPRDLIQIFREIEGQGALQASLIVQ